MIELTYWVADRLNVAQESGFTGINPLVLWINTIDAMCSHADRRSMRRD